MKKYMKWVGIAVLSPMLLIILLTLLLYLPPVQNWAVRQVASYASESTGMDVSVSQVRLVFPLNLGVEGVRVLQPNDSIKNRKDTVADIGKMVADVQLLPLFDGQVMVDRLEFAKMKVNTTNFIHEARIKGNIGKLYLKAHGIDLGKEHVNVNDAFLSDARLSVELSDTVPPDTTPSSNFWKVNVRQLKLKNTDFTLHMPGDTLQVHAFFEKALAEKTYLDLYKGLYQVGRLDWQGGHFAYDNNFERPVSGMDFNHLSLGGMVLEAESFSYCDSKLDIKVNGARFKEKSGLKVDKLYGRVVMDSTKFQLPDLSVATPVSRLQTTLDMDLNAFDDRNPGKLMAQVHGFVGRSDLFLFADGLPKEMRANWPYYPLSIDATVRGNLQNISFSGVKLSLPTAFQLETTGSAAHLTDMNRLKVNADLKARTYNLAFVTALLDPSLRSEVQIPYGIGIQGSIGIDGTKYAAKLSMTEGKGCMKVDATINAPTEKDGSIDMNRLAYQTKIQASNLQAKHFLPRQDLHSFTGTLEAKGTGTDFLSSRTKLVAKAKIVNLHYDNYQLNNIQAAADVANGKIHADIDSKNELLTGLVSVYGLTDTKRLRASVIADVRNADLYLLQLTKNPMNASMCGQVDLNSDLKDNHRVFATMSDVTLKTTDKTYRPVGLNLDVYTRSDTTHAVADCGDFHLDLDAHGGYKKLLDRLDILQKEVMNQLKNRHIDQVKIRRNFPMGHIALSTGKDNFISRFAQYCGCHFKSVEMDLNASPVDGLNGYLNVDSLVANGIQLDTIRANVMTQGDTIRYTARIENNKKNPQYVFRALVKGELQDRGSNIDARIYDANNRLGVDVGLAAMLQDDGIMVSLLNTHPVLGYKNFTANDDNYLKLGDDGRVSANLVLTAAGGMGVRVYSNDDNEDVLQDITVSMGNFNLDKVLSVIPYMPDVSGIMNGDFHVIQTKDELSVSSNLSVNNLCYEKCPMGNVGSEFVYMPKSDGSHYVDGILQYEGKEVASVKGTYLSENDGYLDADVNMAKLPLHFVNGFVPDQLVGLKGYGEGKLSMKGALDKLDVEGEVFLDSAYLVSVPYGVTMRFDNDPVRIVDSKLLFENFMMYANNSSPLNVQGSLDFSNLDRMMLDVRMRAQNFLLIDAKENARSEAYGKAYVNFFGMMQGPLSSLRMRGKLDVLGNTDMTYILRESELTTDNQLDELVKFTNFKDGKPVVVERPALEGFDMSLSLSIDEAAHILCALNTDKSNYIDLMGGGELLMSYNPTDNLQLTGKYTLSNGEMKYSLPVIPLKTFTIQDGSYIEFMGDPFNPTLSITATESVRTTVNESEGSGRSVDFVCGVKLSQTLSQPGIQFIISAPNDVTLQDELNTMSVEEQGKIAITMLVSGMYLSDGNTSSFSMNSALSSFLNSEINNIAGTAMRSIGLDVGMSVDNSLTATGALHTDYNFKFAKRFFNNRLSFSIGGQVSTGAELENATKNNTFFNNVEVQYRLNEGASQYIRAFYTNNTYDWLEGQIGEYGVGFKWQRKLQRFSDIFRFKTEKQNVPAPPAEKVSGKDSTQAKPQSFDPLKIQKN